jgi:hypothetical protein
MNLLRESLQEFALLIAVAMPVPDRRTQNRGPRMKDTK